MTVYHHAFPQLAEQEDALNRSMATGFGPQQRVCLHVDRTYVGPTLINGGTTVSCDYCPEIMFDSGYGPPPHMQAHYYLDLA